MKTIMDPVLRSFLGKAGVGLVTWWRSLLGGLVVVAVVVVRRRMWRKGSCNNLGVK